MHELPIVMDIIKVINSEAEEKKLLHVNSIYLVIGELSAVVGESVQMYFNILSEGTPCQNAKLIFEHKPAKFKCSSCGLVFDHIKSFDCPTCGGDAVLIKGTGHELYIRTIDAE